MRPGHVPKWGPRRGGAAARRDSCELQCEIPLSLIIRYHKFILPPWDFNWDYHYWGWLLGDYNNLLSKFMTSNVKSPNDRIIRIPGNYDIITIDSIIWSLFSSLPMLVRKYLPLRTCLRSRRLVAEATEMVKLATEEAPLISSWLNHWSWNW